MNTLNGYSKSSLTNDNVLLSAGGHKALSDFILNDDTYRLVLVLALRHAGLILYKDTEFNNGNNSVKTYDNNKSNNVTISRIVDNQSSANSSGYIIQITTSGENTAPGLGGFVQTISSRADAVFILVFRAKVPTGYKLVISLNLMGVELSYSWLTDNKGTGKWEWYINIRKCGTTGTFSTGGHIYLVLLSGTTVTYPVTWYLSYCTSFDITKANVDAGIAQYVYNILGGAANQIPYQTSANTTSFISAPTTANTVLKWNGSQFTWGTDNNSDVNVLLKNIAENYNYPLLLKYNSGITSTEPVTNTVNFSNNIYANPYQGKLYINSTGEYDSFVQVTSKNGGSSLALLSANSGSMGLYNKTANKTGWILQVNTDSSLTFINHWRNIGSANIPVYFNSYGNPVSTGKNFNDYLTIASAKNLYTQQISLPTSEYRRVVIATCKLAPKSTSITSYTVGTFYIKRSNGNSSLLSLAIFETEGAHNYSYEYVLKYNLISNLRNASVEAVTTSNYNTLIGIRPCKFMKDGVWYGGFEYYSDASHVNIYFVGKTTEDLTVYPYYATGNGTIGSVDDEIYNSLIYSDNSIIPTNSNITADKIIKTGGTSSLFLKADGSIDSNTYLTLTALLTYLSSNVKVIDENVKQTATSDSNFYPILLKNSADTSNETAGVKFSSIPASICPSNGAFRIQGGILMYKVDPNSGEMRGISTIASTSDSTKTGGIGFYWEAGELTLAPSYIYLAVDNSSPNLTNAGLIIKSNEILWKNNNLIDTSKINVSQINAAPLNLITYNGLLATGGWKTMGGRTSGSKIAIAYPKATSYGSRSDNLAPWIASNYAPTMVFGGNDTHGLISISHSQPVIVFGGSTNATGNDNDPAWYLRIKGATNTEYDLSTFLTSSSASSTYVKKTGDTMSGRLAITLSTIEKLSPTSQLLVINGPTYDASMDRTNLKIWPGIGFHMPGVTYASLILTDKGFCAVNSSYTGYIGFYAANFKKHESSDDYFLLGGGGHVLRSEYLTKSAADSTYLLLTGGTLTGDLNVNTKITTERLIVNESDLYVSGTTTSGKFLKEGGTNELILLANGDIYSINDLAKSSDITSLSSTVSSLLTSVNATKYWANVAISSSSSTSTTPLFARIGVGKAVDSSYSINASGYIYTATVVRGAKGLSVTNSDSTTGSGVSLYGGSYSGSQPTYGIMFAGTATFGKHGSVTSDWATYFTMNNTDTRGWIFKGGSGANGNIASISADGKMTLNSTATAAGFIHSTYNSADYILLSNGTAITKSSLLSGYLTSDSSLSWAKITGKPTTLSGYGITDAASSSSLSNYLSLAGGTMTGNIKRIYSSASDEPMLTIGSADKDILIWKILSTELTYSHTGSLYGYALKYIGTGSGVANYLRLIADNTTSTLVTAIGINLSGQVGIGTDANTGYRLYVSGKSYFTDTISVSGNTVLTSANVSGGGSTWGSSITVNGKTLTIPNIPSNLPSTWTSSKANENYPIAFSFSESMTDGSSYNNKYDTTFYYNPSTHLLNSTNISTSLLTFSGGITPSSNEDYNIGSTTARVATLYTKNVGSSSKYTDYVYTDKLIANSMGTSANSSYTLYVSGNSSLTGTLAINGTTTARSILPATNNSYNLGSSTYKWAYIYGNLAVNDIRGTDWLPSNQTYYPDKSISTFFNNTGMPAENTWYSGITVKGWSNGYALWQLTGCSAADMNKAKNLYYRYGIIKDNTNEWQAWKTILDSSNSSVSKNGQTLTVKIANTTCELTNTTYGVVTSTANGLVPYPSNSSYYDSTKVADTNYVLMATTAASGSTIKWRQLPANAFANTTYSASTGILLSGTYFSVKLKDTSANSLDSIRNTSTTGGLYSVEVDKSGYLAVRVPWTQVTVTDKNATLSWDSTSTIASINNTNISVKMPKCPLRKIASVSEVTQSDILYIVI